MGVVGGLVGLNGGAGGSGFSTPQQASIQSPVTSAQALTSYNQNQDALTQQQNFLNQLAAQNGVQNQSNVFNQLQGVANGTGPNPARAQLAQATAANTANQAALMAGQRGSNANPALIARQAAMQGAQNQQNAAGQAATLQAQQSLGALNQLGGIAGQQVAQQQGGVQNYTGAAQQEQSNLLNSIAGANQARVGSQGSVNSGNAQLANTTLQGQQGLIGGALNAAGGALGLATGGKINKDMVQSPYNGQSQASNTQDFGNPGANSLYKGMSSFGKFISGGNNTNAGDTSGTNSTIPGDSGTNPMEQQQIANQGLANNPGVQSAISDFSFKDGGKVPAMVSPGEIRIPAKDVKKVAEGKKSPLDGEKIKGEAKVKGAKDSYANDTVPKTLNEGDIILPRSVTQSKHPHWAAHAFVQKIMNKNRGLK